MELNRKIPELGNFPPLKREKDRTRGFFQLLSSLLNILNVALGKVFSFVGKITRPGVFYSIKFLIALGKVRDESGFFNLHCNNETARLGSFGG